MGIKSGDEPGAFIGCLGCYNNGRITGNWLSIDEIWEEAAQDEPTSLYGGIAERQPGSVATCSVCGADEFEIQDYAYLSQRIGLRELYESAHLLVEAWMEDEGRFLGVMGILDHGICDSVEDALVWDEENLLATSDDERDLWEEIRDELVLAHLPNIEILGSPLADWIHWESVRDRMEHDILTIERGGMIRAYHNA